MVGLGGDSQMHARSTAIASIEPLALPLSRTMRFRDSNLETVQLVNPPAEFDGVLADKSGNVLGTWSSFAYDNGRELAQENRGVPIDAGGRHDRSGAHRPRAAFARGGARRAAARQCPRSSVCRRSGRSAWRSTRPRGARR